MDILVGWYLELGQTDETISKTTEALISLHDYWIVNMHLCRTLTGSLHCLICTVNVCQSDGCSLLCKYLSWDIIFKNSGLEMVKYEAEMT